MKKIVALSLVVIMLAAIFASCGNNDNPTPASTTGNTPVQNPIIEGFVAVNNETVYVNTEKLNVRSTPSSDDDTNKLGSLDYGKSVTRTGINETTGWSRIIFNSDVAYVYSRYLSSTQPAALESTTKSNETDVPAANFIACNDNTVIYTTEYVNNTDVHREGQDSSVYTAPNRGKEADATLKDGTAVVRIAVYYENANDKTIGWSKITCGDKTYYIRNSQLKISFDEQGTFTTTTAANAPSPTPVA